MRSVYRTRCVGRSMRTGTWILAGMVWLALSACAARSKGAHPWWDTWAKEKATGVALSTPAILPPPPPKTAILPEAPMGADGVVQVSLPKTVSNADRPEGTRAPAPRDRKMTYSAVLELRVANRAAARKQAEEILNKSGGFLQRSTLESITFRLPPDRFDAALAELETLGEVVERQVSAEDLTDQYTDLNLRLDIAEKSRQRLMDLLKSAKETKDLLEIERDLRRLTEEIEKIKGQLRVLNDKIDLATITVVLREKAPESSAAGVRRFSSPFAWIQEVSLNSALDPVPGDDSARLDGGRRLWGLIDRSKFHLGTPQGAAVPEKFVPLWHTEDTLIAATPEDYRLRARTFPLRQESTLDFWAKALEAQLRDVQGWLVKTDPDFAPDQKGLQARALHCEAGYAGQTWNYDVWLLQRNGRPKEILVVEFACLKKDAGGYDPMVAQAVRGARYGLAERY